jgi:hypothetical protein
MVIIAKNNAKLNLNGCQTLREAEGLKANNPIIDLRKTIIEENIN